MGNLITSEAQLMDDLAKATNDSPSVCHEGEEIDEWIDLTDDDDDSIEEYEDVELEDDQDFEERLLILHDCEKLKELAKAFLHPELPVQVDPTTKARCYFDRYSAPVQQSREDMEEQSLLEHDVMNLKRLARDYLHPELPVLSNDATATARCYFDRYSAPVQQSLDEMEEQIRIEQDIQNLKRLAQDFLHPELPVTSHVSLPQGDFYTMGSVSSRCYFERYSAPQQMSLEEAEYINTCLQDAKLLKQLAVDYLHPEMPVMTKDATTCARCYFDRYSASKLDEKESDEHEKAVVESSPTSTVVQEVVAKQLEQSIGFRHASEHSASASAVNLYGLDDDLMDVPTFNC